jgi:hypothetical protein
MSLQVMLAMVLQSHAGDGAVRCRVMLAMVLSSHAEDSTAGVTEPQRDVDAESCWQRFCRFMLATVLP